MFVFAVQVLLNQWVESTYLSARVRAQVQTQMERASEVCLRDVLQPARCRALLDALEAPGDRSQTFSSYLCVDSMSPTSHSSRRRGVGALRAGAAAALLARGGALAGAGGGRGGAARGARAGAPAGRRGLAAPAGRLHRPAARLAAPPRAAALGARGLHRMWTHLYLFTNRSSNNWTIDMTVVSVTID